MNMNLSNNYEETQKIGDYQEFLDCLEKCTNFFDRSSFAYCFIISSFRKCSLKSEKKQKKCLYNFSIGLTYL